MLLAPLAGRCFTYRALPHKRDDPSPKTFQWCYDRQAILYWQGVDTGEDENMLEVRYSPGRANAA